MRRMGLILVALILAVAKVNVALAYDYPSCLLRLTAGARGPVIVLGGRLSEGEVLPCIRKHFQKHLPQLKWSSVSVSQVPEIAARRKIENWEANMLLLDAESSSAGGRNILGVTTALSGDPLVAEPPELRHGDDWTEVARFSTMFEGNGSITGRLRGETKYWKTLGQLTPRALTDETGRRISSRKGQHFHLIQIHCSQD